MANMSLKTALELALKNAQKKQLTGYQQLIYERLKAIAEVDAETAEMQGMQAELLKELHTATALWDATDSLIDAKITDSLLMTEDGTLSIDLNNYYTKQEVQALLNTLDANSQADWDATDRSDVSYIKNKPTKLSQFENDEGFIKDHQSLAAYATKAYVDEAVANVDTQVDLTDYAKTSDIPIKVLSSDTTIQKVYNLANGLYYAPASLAFTTGEFLNGVSVLKGLFEIVNGEQENSKGIISIECNELGQLDKNGNLSNPVLASFTYSKDEIDNMLANVDLTGYATEEFVTEALKGLDVDIDLTDYVTKEELESKQYLTEHQKLDSYATHDYVMEQITNVATSGEIDLSGYASKEYVNERLEQIDLSDLSIPTKVSELENDSQFITADDIAGLDLTGVNISTFEGNIVELAAAEDGFYYVPGVLSFTNASDFDEDVEVTQTEIHGLVHKVSYENKIRENYSTLTDEEWATTWSGFIQEWTQTNSKYLLLSAVITNYDLNTESYVDYNGKLRSQTMLADSYTREQIDEILLEYATLDWVEEQGYLTEHQSLEGLVNEDTLVAKIIELAKDGILIAGETEEDNVTIQKAIVELQNAGYITESELLAKGYLTSDDMPSFGFLKLSDLASYATQSYVQEQIAQASLGGNGDGAGVDLSAYATKEYVDGLGHITKITTAQSVSDFVARPDGLYDIDNVKNVVLEVEYNDKKYNVFGPVYLKKVGQTATFWDLKSGDMFRFEDSAGTGLYDLREVSGTDTSVIQYIDGLGYLKSVPEEYVTETELAEKGFATTAYVDAAVAAGGGTSTPPDLAGYATETFVENKITDVQNLIPVLPTEVSAFNNDAGYITNAALGSYATTNYVDTAIVNAKLGSDGSGTSGADSIDLTKYATIEYVNGIIPTVPTVLSGFTNDKGFVTGTEVDTKITTALAGVPSGSKVEFETVNIDFSNFTF